MRKELFTEVSRGMVLGDEAPMTPHGYAIGGFHEVVLSVSNLDISRKHYQKISGWEEVAYNDLSRDQLDFWHLSEVCHGTESLLACRGAGKGHVRLVAFEGVHQESIRADSQPWDTGGIFDIDVRTTDMDATYTTLTEAGWLGFSDPLTYEAAEFRLEEVLMQGPDDVVLAIIKRYHPPLVGYEHMKSLSEVFNTAQMVRDMEVSKKFYVDVLGYKIYREMILDDAPGDQNLFGMPRDLWEQVDCKICMLNPKDENIGTIELVEMSGVEGRDCAKTAHPPNLGMLMLRMPVSDIEQMEKHLRKRHIDIKSAPKELEIKPYGRCKCLALQSPDGAWLEFIEVLDN